MRKLLKFVLIASAVLAGIVLIGMIGVAGYIHVKYPPEKMKALATQKLSQVLHHKVSVGKVDFDFWNGFRITDLVISNRAGWMDTPLVAAKEISISYHLYELVAGYFGGKVSLGEIRLNQPQILVERRGLNAFNFSDMTGGSAEAAPAPAKASKKAKPKGKAKPKKKHKTSMLPSETGSPLAGSFFADSAWAGTAGDAADSKSTLLFSADSLNILHGKLVYVDETVSPAQRSDLQDLNFRVNHISMDGGKTSFSLDTPFSYNKVAYNLQVGGSYRYFLSSQSLKDLDVKGKVNDLGFKVSGSAEDMTENFTPDLDGEASLDMLKFSGLVPKSLSSMPEGLDLSGPAKVTFHLDGSSKKGLKLKGVADGAQLAIQYKDLFIKEADSPCKLEFTSVMGPDYYDLPSFQATFQDWELDGNFHYQNGSYYSGQLHSKSLPLKGLSKVVPKFKKAVFSGAASLNVKVHQKLGKIQTLDLEGQAGLKGIGVSLPDDPHLFQDFNGTIVFSGPLVKMTGATFKTFEGTGAASLAANLVTTAYSYAFNLKNVSAQEAVDGWVDVAVTKDPKDYKDKLFGSLSLNYQGTGRGLGGDAMISSAAGSGVYVITDAKVKGLAAVKTLNGFFKDKSDEIQFDKINGTLAMKNKVFSYTANNTGKVGAIRVVGGVNADGVYTPDMKVQCDVKKDFIDSNQVQSSLPAEVRGLVKDPAFLADDAGNIPADFKFTGKAKENNWTFDWGRLKNNVMRNVAKEVQKSGVQGVKDLGKKLKLW